MRHAKNNMNQHATFQQKGSYVFSYLALQANDINPMLCSEFSYDLFMLDVRQSEEFRGMQQQQQQFQ